MYDPTIGRFLSEDPSQYLGGDSNLSRYVHNSPTNLIDPTGLTPYEPVVTDPNGTFPVWIQALENYWDQDIVDYISANGCYALCNVNLGLYAAGWMLGTIYNAPGVSMFGNYDDAQQYAAQNPGSTLFAYQNTMVQPESPNVATSTPGFEPTAPGQLDPASLPSAQCGEQNWAVLMQNEEGEWYWQTMANAGGDIENMPFNPDTNEDPYMGLPETGNNTDTGTGQPNAYTNFFGVYVPPPTAWQQFWASVWQNMSPYGPTN